MAVKQKILIVDDDNNIAELISLYLTKECYDTKIVNDGEQALIAFEHYKPNMLLLDLMLPGIDGYQVCREIRAKSDVPIIMLSAKGEVFDKVLGLELGADDYIPKPFNPRELLARIHAVLRRRPQADPPGAPSMDNEIVKFGDFELNLGTRVLKKNGENVPLTTGEFAVLKSFARHPRQPLSRDKLMEMARGREYEAFDRSLDVQVSRLRKLIEPDPSKPRYLQTVWGLGYVFIPDGKLPPPKAGK